jgi:hypothetical protein
MSASSTPEAGLPIDAPRQLTLRFDGVCVRCGKSLPKGSEALYDFSIHKPRCVVCQVVDDPGMAGASAEREFEHRKAVRKARVKRQLGDIFGELFLATAVEPQTTLAWKRGAIGERRLAETLATLPEAMLLHDRRVPHTRANIDHIVVAPAGVFVVDAKLYRGVIQIRDVGGLFHSDQRLFVGRWDKSRIAEKMAWEASEVQRALNAARSHNVAAVVPVVCFVDANWGWPTKPRRIYRDVWLEDARLIVNFMSGTRVLDTQAISDIHHTLAVAFPPK